ncbi:unnamed protein product [Paramecium sonneborni]|uniref:Uncharacterized protein n=1 Tax=Paramecium sonneborni TaxID=65129 RepID=A0A8S1NNQ7_9CILI|nr:unnamed protein product [Paramecium sonneborni]
MIASKVFKKEGKKIKADSQTQILNKNLIQQRSIQKEQLNHKQTIVELKKKQLSDIIQKFKAANLLVQRNKSLESTLKQSLFHFPILIFSSQINNQIFIRDKKYLKILMKSKVNFIADLDVVKNLYLETIDLKYLIEECQNLFI